VAGIKSESLAGMIGIRNWLYSLCRLVDPTARDGLVDQIVSHLSTQPR
jgi:hypothetical protein